MDPCNLPYVIYMLYNTIPQYNINYRFVHCLNPVFSYWHDSWLVFSCISAVNSEAIFFELEVSQMWDAENTSKTQAWLPSGFPKEKAHHLHFMDRARGERWKSRWALLMHLNFWLLAMRDICWRGKLLSKFCRFILFAHVHPSKENTSLIEHFIVWTQYSAVRIRVIARL